MKVLISAYACEPGRGSEPEVGWQTAIHLAQLHEVTVLTRANNKPLIDKGLASLEGRPPEFIYYDLPKWMIWLKKRGLSVAIYYLFWQLGARLFMRGKLGRFELIHHCTFNSFRQPGFWWLTGKAVVLGPLGGGQVCPWNFLPWFRRQVLYEIFRSLTVLCGYVLPQILTSMLSARRILVANGDTMKCIPWFFRAKAAQMLETAVTPGQIVERSGTRPEGPSRFLWVSRLDKMKGGELAIRAFAQALHENSAIRLTIGGAGPEEKPLRALIEKLGIGASVDWRGRIPKEEVTSVMASHDAFLFTSLRDTSGNVMLEAMAVGMPVIAFAHHGAVEISTPETAIRVPVTSSTQTIAAMKDGILKLAGDPDLAQRMGIAGQNRVKEVFTWEKQAARLDKMFTEAMGEQKVLDTLQKRTFEALFSIRGVFFALVLALGVAVLEFGVVRMMQTRTDSMVEQTLPRLSRIAAANAMLTESFSHTVMALHTDDPEKRQTSIRIVEQLTPKTTAELDAYARSTENGTNDSLFELLLRQRAEYLAARARVFESLQSGDHAGAIQIYESTLLPAYDAYQRSGDRLLHSNIEDGRETGATLVRICRVTELALVIAALFIFVIGFTVGFSR